jgi:hypothetical protein
MAIRKTSRNSGQLLIESSFKPNQIDVKRPQREHTFCLKSAALVSRQFGE